MSLGRFFWGLFFVLLGLVFLLVNYGVLSPSVFSQIWKLWPLLIVAIGFSVLAKGTSRVIGILLSVLIFLIVLAGVYFAVAPTVQCSSKTCLSTNTSIGTQTISEALQADAKSTQVTIEMGAGDLQVSGGSSLLVEGEIIGNVASQIQRDLEGGVDKIDISSTFRGGTFWLRSFKNDWNLKLNKELPLDLAVKNGATDSKIDLRQTNLENLDIEGGASSYEITLPAKKGTIHAQLQAGASSITIRVPKSAGVSINSEIGLSSNNFTNRELVKSDSKYTSKNYSSAEEKIDLTLKAGASSIDLEYY